jgi:plasmid replication initiation protein
MITTACSWRSASGHQCCDRQRAHQFSWISEWERCIGRDGKHYGIDLVVPNWFYTGVLDRQLILTVDPAYFQLSGGIARWLYRVVRKHAGWQRARASVPRNARKPRRADRPWC